MLKIFIILVTLVWLIAFFISLFQFLSFNVLDSIGIKQLYLFLSVVLFFLFAIVFYFEDFSFGQLVLCKIYYFNFGLDAKSLFLILLTLFLFPIVILAS